MKGARRPRRGEGRGERRSGREDNPFRGVQPPAPPDDVLRGGEGEGDDGADDGGEPLAEFRYVVREGEETRLDRFLSERADGAYSREYLKELIQDGMVWVDGRPAKPARIMRAGEVVEVTVPPPEQLECLPENIPLTVRYEDSELLVVEKPRGMLTHPIGRCQSGTFVNALLHHCTDLAGIGGTLRPGIVHRLDVVTSGLLVVAKTDRTMRALQDMFRERRVEKRYLALVVGHPLHDRGLVDAPIGRHPQERNSFRVDLDGRPSQTSYEVLRSYGTTSLVELYLHTGRTHQIRVHMRFLGHPVVGDTLYGARPDPLIPDGIALHAFKLSFRHPVTGDEITRRAPLPHDILAVMRRELGRA